MKRVLSVLVLLGFLVTLASEACVGASAKTASSTMALAQGLSNVEDEAEADASLLPSRPLSLRAHSEASALHARTPVQSPPLTRLPVFLRNRSLLL